MSREAQALGRVASPSVGLRVLKLLPVAVACLVAASCAARGIDIDQAAVDTMTTASIPAPPAAAADTYKVSDEATIRNAVSSADVEAVQGTGISWQNSESGARGAITALAEYKRKGRLCRSFDASRESYDGVAVYKGEACQTGDGAWSIMRFDEN